MYPNNADDNYSNIQHQYLLSHVISFTFDPHRDILVGIFLVKVSGAHSHPIPINIRLLIALPQHLSYLTQLIIHQLFWVPLLYHLEMLH